MSGRMRAGVSLVCGFLVSGLGILLAEFGGWGPCGPHGAMGLGAFVIEFPFFVLARGGLEEVLIRAASPALNVTIMLLVPGVCWSVVAWGIMRIGSEWGRRRAHEKAR